MLVAAFSPASLSSRTRRHHRRRQNRQIRLFKLPFPSNRPRQSHLAQAHGTAAAESLSTGPIFQYGDYVLGDENCPFLYGPTDIRY